MEDKINKTEKKPLPVENVRWHHSRWFWGVVLGVVFVLVYNYYFNLMSLTGAINKSPTSISDISEEFIFSLLIIPSGIVSLLLIPMGASGRVLYNEIPSSSIFIYSFVMIYYLIILFLLYKTFMHKKVKIKYPIILIAILISSIFGIMISSIAS